MEVGVHEAKTHLSKLLQQVASGEEVIITRGGQPVARLVAITPRTSRKLGADAGRVRIDPTFDDPLPPEWSELIEP
jgi:prevent-host-death family protein